MILKQTYRFNANLKLLFLEKTADRDEYLRSLNETGDSSPYHQIAFLEYFSNGFDGLVCFKWEREERLVLLNGYLLPIKTDSDWKDFRSPYGYSGPIYKEGIEESFLTNFWKDVNYWMGGNKIVSSFIRFSLVNNSMGYKGKIKPTLLNVNGGILKKEEQWLNFAPKVRKNVKRAIREGLQIKIVSGLKINDPQLNSFYKIYTSTLTRNSASQDYYYPFSAIKKYCKREGSSCVFAFVYDVDKIISTEMVLLSKKNMYSFLGGTEQTSLNKRPNDFLKYSLINWARENNYKLFILGGGHGKEDGIFEYKKSFFPNDIIPFYTGRQIINMKKYYEFRLINYSTLSPNDKEEQLYKDFFPAYRYKT